MMVDKESGSLYRCDAGFVVRLLNSDYLDIPVPTAAKCTGVFLGGANPTPNKFSWQLLPAADIGPTDPGASQPPAKYGYFWQASAGAIQVCLQSPVAAQFPVTKIFGPTTCIQPVPVVAADKSVPSDDTEIAVPPPN
jgi:hypothetical protein